MFHVYLFNDVVVMLHSAVATSNLVGWFTTTSDTMSQRSENSLMARPKIQQ